MAEANSIEVSMTNKSGKLSWRKIGRFLELKRRLCQRIYAQSGKHKDLALFYHDTKFYAMEAWCSHMGGPLYLGDIEDYKGTLHVMCPWHSYMFDLATGKNELGIQQQVFEVKVDVGDVYILYTTDLSLYRYPDINKKSNSFSGITGCI